MPNRFFLRPTDLPDQLDDFHMFGAIKVDGVVSLVVGADNSDGAGLIGLSPQDVKNLIDVLSSPHKLKESR